MYLKLSKTDFVFLFSPMCLPLSRLAGMGDLTDFLCTSMRQSPWILTDHWRLLCLPSDIYFKDHPC